MSIDFCSIAPTNYLQLVKNRPTALVLAHLIEDDLNGKTDGTYTEFYKNESKKGTTIIVDNSGFEYYKRGLPMMESNKLIPIAQAVDGDYVVLSDYPGEPGRKTIQKAEQLIPEFKQAGFKTFFVPQSEVGDFSDYMDTIVYGLKNDDIDMIGVSILGAPNAFGVERDNKLQRYLSRYHVMSELHRHDMLTEENKNIFHFLGLTDGPRELELVKSFDFWINSCDSSSPVQHGILNKSYDKSPTGLLHGKDETEVDFDIAYDESAVDVIKSNLRTIDDICY